MPVIKILHVCSFSSEDPVSEVDYIHITSYFFQQWISLDLPGLCNVVTCRLCSLYCALSLPPDFQNHPAENLLNAETYRKWKCATAGEKQAVVVLQVCIK